MFFSMRILNPTGINKITRDALFFKAAHRLCHCVIGNLIGHRVMIWFSKLI